MCVGEECGYNPQDRNFQSITFIIIHEKLNFYYLLLIQAPEIFSNPQYCFQTPYNTMVCLKAQNNLNS